jgi:hypothetical protein
MCHHAHDWQATHACLASIGSGALHQVRQRSVTFCGEQEGRAPNLSCWQTLLRKRAASPQTKRCVNKEAAQRDGVMVVCCPLCKPPAPDANSNACQPSSKRFDLGVAITARELIVIQCHTSDNNNGRGVSTMASAQLIEPLKLWLSSFAVLGANRLCPFSAILAVDLALPSIRVTQPVSHIWGSTESKPTPPLTKRLRIKLTSLSRPITRNVNFIRPLSFAAALLIAVHCSKLTSYRWRRWHDTCSSPE